MDIEAQARQLGKLISQTPEYHQYERASRTVGEDAELRELVTKLQELENKINELVHNGKEVTEQTRTDYEKVLGELQGRSNFQSLIAGQENYLKLMNKVNELIAEGIREGGKSRIITSF